MQPVNNKNTDAVLIEACIAISGGYRSLERATGISRVTCWRLQNGKQKRLQPATREKLQEYVNGQYLKVNV